MLIEKLNFLKKIWIHLNFITQIEKLNQNYEAWDPGQKFLLIEDKIKIDQQKKNFEINTIKIIALFIRSEF